MVLRHKLQIGEQLLTLTEQLPMLVLWHLKASLRRKRQQVLGERLDLGEYGQRTRPPAISAAIPGHRSQLEGAPSRVRCLYVHCGQEAVWPDADTLYPTYARCAIWPQKR